MIAKAVRTVVSSNTRGRCRWEASNVAKRIRNGANEIAPTKDDIAREIEISDVPSAKDTFSLWVLIPKNP
jgi:hypothetical protein